MPRVLVPLAPGFEEIEAVTIIDVLRRAGVTVDVAGTEPGPITGSHGITVTPDHPLSGLDADAYDLIALPGGMPGTLHLRQHPEVRRLVHELAERGRFTTAICAAPTVLAAAGVTAGRAVTSHPSVEGELAAAAGSYRTDPVVVDGSVITSRGAGTAMEFALALVERLVGRTTADHLRAHMVVAPAAGGGAAP
jgi:4-methyl-5(b-hydroxyethyl)-thiazole monophosphate biosynthesis